MTRKDVYVAKVLKGRKMQRALVQFFKPDNWFEARKALLEAGRTTASRQRKPGRGPRP